MEEKNFTWDENKNKSNIKKHGVSFNEAWTVFNDEFVLLYCDDEHSYNEERFIAIGASALEKILVVCHCYRENDEIIRLISARKADKHESDDYYGGMI
jgi:hypothetical protein